MDKSQQLRIIELQQRIIEAQQNIIDALCQQQAILTNAAFPSSDLTPENEAMLKRCQEQVPPSFNLYAARLMAIFDQINAAKEELKILEGE